MNKHLDPHGEHFTPAEQDIDRALRPLRFSDFMGQPQVLDNLQVFVQAANQREDALDHILLHGPPGLGKTTLAHILGNELQVGVKVTSGPVLDKPGDLAGLLTNLESRDVLFIDEIHRLSPIVEEYLYSAMEDYKIDIMIESGPKCPYGRNQPESVYTNRSDHSIGLADCPMRARFGINCRLTYYTTEVLSNHS
jgi:Holliday junction DNA helicase RuvB